MPEDIQQDTLTKPLLTIAIPTYNREAFLRTLLASLFDQLRDEPRVELIVSDNASTDQTQAVVAEYQKLGLRIRSMRNEVNIGSDANFLQCYEEATAKYVLIFGDDDLIVPGGVAKILAYLSGEEYNLVHLSHISFKGAFDPTATPIKSKGALVCTQAAKFALKVNVMFTFISANIVNKDRIEQESHRPFRELVGTNLVQFGWTYTALERDGASLFIQEPLVAALADNTGAFDIFGVLGRNLKRITEEWISTDAVRRPIVNAMLIGHFPHHLLAVRRKDPKCAREYDAALRLLFRDNPRYWIFDFPVAHLPAPLGRLWVIMTKSIYKVDAHTGRWLLRGSSTALSGE